jgi:hypothetical protein
MVCSFSILFFKKFAKVSSQPVNEGSNAAVDGWSEKNHSENSAVSQMFEGSS